MKTHTVPEDTNWIEDNIFVLTGLNDYDKEKITDLIDVYGGEVKNSVVLKTNYLIYDKGYYETTKMKKAKELIAKGKPIKLITREQFLKQIALLPMPELDLSIIPSTHKECKKIFKGKPVPKEGVYIISGTKRGLSTVVIPGIVDGLPVIIESNGFKFDADLETLIFSEGVIGIQSSAFEFCENLKNVTFSSTMKYFTNNPFSTIFQRTPWIDNQGDFLIINNILVAYIGRGPEVVIPHGVEHINGNAFEFSSVRKIIIPDTVRSVGDWAFNACGSLEEIKLPNTIRSIGESAFFGCNALKEITIPDGVKELPDSMFYSCSSLERVILPSTITTIGESAFWDCTSLTEINLPDTIRSLGTHAFEGCKALKEITIPDGVEELPYELFCFCTALQRVNLPSTIERIESRFFYECPKLTIYAPAGSYIEQYAKTYKIPFKAL